MADLLLEGDAVLRAADAVLRANGGRSVLLRYPAPAAAGSAVEELGLATPQFQDMEMGPAVFRKAESTVTLLVAASAVTAMVSSLAFDSADVLFEVAVGVVVDGVVYVIEKSVASQAMGEPYCYCLTLRTPVR
jgi:hypothetical protein